MTKGTGNQKLARKLQKATGRSYSDCYAQQRGPREKAGETAGEVAADVAREWLQARGHTPILIGDTFGCLCGVMSRLRPDLAAPHLEASVLIGKCK